MSIRVRALSLLMVAASVACSSAPAPTTNPSPRPFPDELKWLRTAAEYPAITLQTYRMATRAVLERSRTLPPGSWGVILDADETVLDNSEEERRDLVLGRRFSEAIWADWVRERAATAVPGAVGFIHAVQQAGGRVAIVTNRADSLCPDTRANLEAVGVHADAVLCKPPTTSDKNPRFEALRQGTPPSPLGPLTIVAWVGDNIQDFPGGSQAARDQPGALDPVGVTWFVLPNPMYGSWERNPDR
jgi:5'-nucleotidase (lipoprotein e(P4) family)